MHLLYPDRRIDVCVWLTGEGSASVWSEAWTVGAIIVPSICNWSSWLELTESESVEGLSECSGGCRVPKLSGELGRKAMSDSDSVVIGLPVSWSPVCGPGWTVDWSAVDPACVLSVIVR